MTRINTNVSSLVGRNNLNRANASLSQALTRLSTGLRINTGKDDPAGLIASENLRSDITSIRRAISNTDRANQVIATADSSLGQVSSLLNDIRGLVTESANAGALSDEQIAANQLQVDSSLAALNRIAQTTTFQGRRLLDGSLDFITSAGTNFTNVANLQIDQANLGATGSVNVDIDVATAATKAVVDIESIPTTSTPAAATADLDFTLNQSATAGSVTAGGTFTVDIAADQSSLSAVTLTNSDISFATTAGGGLDGLAGNIDVVFDNGEDTNGDVASVAFDGSTLTISIDDGATTFTTIKNAVDTFVDGGNGVAAGDIIATVTTGGGTFVTGDITTFGTQSLTGGLDAQADQTATFTASTAAGENFAIDFAVATSGAGTGVTVTGDASSGYTVTIGQNYNGDLDTIAAQINTDIGEIADAAFSSNLAFDATEADNASVANSVTISGGSGTGAVGTLALDITTTSNTIAFNNYTFNITEGGGTTDTVTATLDDTNSEIDINITGTVTGQAIVDAISGISGLSASLDATNSTSGFSLSGTSYVEASDSSPSGVTITGGDAGGGLTEAVVFELSGADGSEVLSFGIGTTITELVAGINLVSDATGVQAAVNSSTSDTLDLQSTAYGSNAFVDIKIISEGTGSTPAGTFTTAVAQGERNLGDDVVASVNGVVATGDGNNLAINTSTLDLSATITAAFTGTASFTITGGGALFQLGPDVVSNQQARLGIGSVNTARLGGVNGKLFQLGSGGSADLASDTTTAARIVEEAIDQVTLLRGRLGAFQRTTLETNKNALNDTLTNPASMKRPRSRSRWP